jgi:hypothetical protein
MPGLPEGLADYSAVEGWTQSAAMPMVLGSNIGMLLRWCVAVAQINAFSRLPTADTVAALDAFGEETRRALSGSNLFASIDGMADFGSDAMARRSIYSFAVRDPVNPVRWLGPDELRTIYRALAIDAAENRPCEAEDGDGLYAAEPFLIGQPVQVGGDSNGPIGALRIAASAPSIMTGGGAGKVERLFGKLTSMLRKRHSDAGSREATIGPQPQ